MPLANGLDFEVRVYVKGSQEPVVLGGTFPDSVTFIRGELASLEVNRNVQRALQGSFDHIRATTAVQMREGIKS